MRVYRTVTARLKDVLRAQKIVAAALFCLICSSAHAGTVPENGDLDDFRAIISKAKTKVFPSVVFLMPIAERYDTGKREKSQVAGSGVIISPDGEVVTNWHVINKAITIRCLLYDGTVRDAEIIGSDKDTDLALLRLSRKGDETFPVAELGDSSQLEEGMFVMAMGAPWGLSRSLSLGILSCVNRVLSENQGEYNLWLQTDASINPGNSGGPLVDTTGVVIGINTLGSFIGGDMAFAIPSNTVKTTVAALRRDGKVIRSWTGIRLQPLRDFERNIFYDDDEGVLVSGVDADSPAEAAGIKAGDLILQVADKPISGVNREDLPAIKQLLAELDAGKPVSVAGLREGKPFSIEITPRDKGKVEGDDFDCRKWNMTVKSINEFSSPMLYFFRPTGVYIQGIKYPGNAQSAGLMQGDILLEADGKPIANLDDCKKVYDEVVKDEKRDKKVNLTIMRAGLKRYCVLDYAPRYGQD